MGVVEVWSTGGGACRCSRLKALAQLENHLETDQIGCVFRAISRAVCLTSWPWSVAVGQSCRWSGLS